MPEALAIVAVFAVAIVIYVVLWVQSRNPALYDPRKELTRLQHHVTWLEHRLAVARGEQWGDEMVEGIAAELATSRQQLAQLDGQVTSLPRSAEATH